MSEVMIKPLTVERLHQVLLRHLPLGRQVVAAPVTEPIDDTGSIFDDHVYRELFPLGDPEGADCLNQYLSTAERLTTELQTLIAERPSGGVDREAIAAAAHQLAGCSLAVGAVRLGHAARALEQAARAPESGAQEADTSVLWMLDAAIRDQFTLVGPTISAFLVKTDAESRAAPP